MGDNLSFKDRYWFFNIPEYYPCGGLRDIEFTSNDLIKVKEFIENSTKEGDICENNYIFDSVEREYID